MVVVTDGEANEIKAAMQPIRDTFYDEAGRFLNGDPEDMAQRLWRVVELNKAVSARIAAVGVYSVNNKKQEQALTFIDPHRRPMFAKILPTKKITINNAPHLAELYALVLDNSKVPNLHTSLSTLVFSLLFIKSLQDTTASDISDLGHMVTWFAYDFVQDVVHTARQLGL